MRVRGTRGFTLVELMVVIVILGGLVALVLPNVMGTHDDATRRTAVIQMSSLAEAIDLHVVRTRHLPKDLQALAEPGPDGGEPFLRDGRIPRDPWGAEFEYRPTGPRTFEIRSPGPDGAPDTEDDLVWPPKSSR
jgi:general secretion pathway protein G